MQPRGTRVIYTTIYRELELSMQTDSLVLTLTFDLACECDLKTDPRVTSLRVIR